MGCVDRVLIVGGGLAGLTCALAMRRKGLAVDLVELATEPVGAAITIMGQACKALEELEIRGLCEEEGVTDPLDRGGGTIRRTACHRRISPIWEFLMSPNGRGRQRGESSDGFLRSRASRLFEIHQSKPG